MEKRLRLVNKNAPTLDQILMAVDALVEKLPLHVQSAVSDESLVNESLKKGAESELATDVDQYSLLWRNFGEDFDKVHALYNIGDEIRETADGTAENGGDDGDSIVELEFTPEAVQLQQLYMKKAGSGFME